VTSVPAPGPPSRAARVTIWLLIGLGVTVTVAVLAFVAVLFSVSHQLSGHQRQVSGDELAHNRARAAEFEQRLRTAAVDGQLTDAEIGAAVSNPWGVTRTGREIRVVNRFPGNYDAARCYTYTFALPLGPQSRVTRTESISCPEVYKVYHPPASRTPVP